ncbi:tripartite tricarboxylate transporter substrate binding protein [Ottowia sp. SB7-C50]|uniref:Bug family tripartite tricarboxylate transporter substrate binding protein n=1 Tax=Ottowia sp. SB7-C50 TaxID=3081231 RepID=UPI00295583EE|nr:tripartite tricarboxylate transporter substrate binding protein [Ottowia sp. SB7-C50]WOP16774.1 tripartite tricarboxylate transporter substrate binding protein [Ottowia sp. SB7-C50]
MQRRQFVARTLAATLLCGLAMDASAQTYPNQMVKFIIPFPPGGTLDAVGRSLAQKLGEQMGQTFIVENRPGANGTIGANAVAKANPDGYTLLFNASTFTSAPMTMKSVPYSVTKDFAPVALVAKAPLSVAINKNLPVTDIKSLIAHAKTVPGGLKFAIGSTGSAGHLSTELLRQAGNFDLMIVPYKGTGPAFQDLLGGVIDGFIDPIVGSLQFHKSGQLRVVAVTSEKRAVSLPDVPTVGETIPGYSFYSWYGLWAPARTPPEITQRLNAEVNKALAGPMRDKITQQGLEVTPGSQDDFLKFQAKEMARYQKVITEGKIHAD